jgi:hypothetical protein
MKKPYRNIKTVLKEQIFVLWKFKRNLRMAHTCNPSYLGVEIRRISVGSQLWANTLGDSISEKIHHKKRLAQAVKSPA